MALTPCPECDAQISQKAKSCPKCGYPFVEPSAQQAIQSPPAGRQLVQARQQIRPLGIVLGFALLVIGLMLLLDSPYQIPGRAAPVFHHGEFVPALFDQLHSSAQLLSLTSSSLSKMAGIALVLLGGAQLAFGSTKIKTTRTSKDS